MTDKKLEKGNKLKAKIEYLERKVVSINTFLSRIDNVRQNNSSKEIKYISFRNSISFINNQQNHFANDVEFNEQSLFDDEKLYSEILEEQYTFQNSIRIIVEKRITELREEYNEL